MATVRDALKRAEDELAAGSLGERARRDAEMLLRSVLGRDKAWLITNQNSAVDGDAAVQLEAAIVRRLRGEPIQQIIGECEFYGLPFRVTRDVLIPRPETEHLVEAVLELALGSAAARIVDVGTGSGAIAVALAHALKSDRVTAIDISKQALAVARENAARNGVQIRFLEGDLLAPVGGETFDVVVSNPPYVPDADRKTLPVEVREYEPGLALFAGKNGLDVYRRLIPQAFHTLNPGGHVLLEIGYGQAQAVRELLEQSGFFNVRFRPDLQGIPRVLDAMRGKD